MCLLYSTRYTMLPMWIYLLCNKRKESFHPIAWIIIVRKYQNPMNNVIFLVPLYFSAALNTSVFFSRNSI